MEGARSDVDALWEAVVAVLGDGITALIFRRALQVALPQNPGLEVLEISPQGVVRAESGAEGDPPPDGEGLAALAHGVIDIVEAFSGVVLAPQLRALVDKGWEAATAGGGE